MKPDLTPFKRCIAPAKAAGCLPSDCTMRNGSFLITIDTEGDNAWARPRRNTTRNSQFLPRFQSLCERFGFKPTYLTNYEMARCPAFQEFARDVLRRSAGEVG